MREHFPIISNICSGRITGINFLTFANRGFSFADKPLYYKGVSRQTQNALWITLFNKPRGT
jgi:hypothetical protein